jgi:hypothetical protein
MHGFKHLADAFVLARLLANDFAEDGYRRARMLHQEFSVGQRLGRQPCQLDLIMPTAKFVLERLQPGYRCGGLVVTQVSSQLDSIS